MKFINKFILLALCTLLVSCAEDVSVSYSGPSVVEFPLAASNVAEGAGEISVSTQLVGPQESSPLSINFQVDDNSTAVEGTHYSLVSDGSFEIPASSSFGEIVVDVADGTLNAGEEVTLILTLTGGDYEPSENYKTHTMTIVGQ